MADELENTPWKKLDVLGSDGEVLVTLNVPESSNSETVLSVVMETAAGLGAIVKPNVDASQLTESELNWLMLAAARGLMLSLMLMRDGR